LNRLSTLLAASLILLRVNCLAEPIKAVDAVSQGLINLEAESVNSYQETEVKVKNRTDQPQEVDLSGTGLIPANGDEQRIGLTYVQGENDGIVHVDPHDTITETFESRCLDQDRPAPESGERLKLLRSKLPSYVSRLLRNNASQSEVWDVTNGSHKSDWGSMDPRGPYTKEDPAEENLIGTWRDAGTKLQIKRSGYYRMETETAIYTGKWSYSNENGESTLVLRLPDRKQATFRISQLSSDTMRMSMDETGDTYQMQKD
jgi:hypothetical protein